MSLQPRATVAMAREMRGSRVPILPFGAATSKGNHPRNRPYRMVPGSATGWTGHPVEHVPDAALDQTGGPVPATGGETDMLTDSSNTKPAVPGVLSRRMPMMAIFLVATMGLTGCYTQLAVLEQIGRAHV